MKPRKGTMRTRLICSAVVLAALVFVAGCIGDTNLKAYNVGPWPLYDEPAALDLTDAEKATATPFIQANPELWRKIQGQSNAWRAIVQKHNEKALEGNINQLVALGYDKDLATRMVLASASGKNIKALEQYQPKQK